MLMRRFSFCRTAIWRFVWQFCLLCRDGCKITKENLEIGNEMGKVLKCLLWIFLPIIALVGLVFVGEKVFYADFYFGGCEIVADLPGLWTGFVPQGFDQLEDGTLLVSGYDNGGDPSAVYVITETDEMACELYEKNGEPYTSHAGGIAHFGDYIYINKNIGEELAECDMFLVSDVVDGDGKATICDSFTVPARLSYCAIYNGKLYGGAFYKENSSYDTPEYHHLTTPCGDKNTALMMVFALDPATGKLANEIPEQIYSTTSKVQGMCFTDSGRMVLSTSYGLSTSVLYSYDLTKAKTTTFDFNGTQVPLAYLDSDCLAETQDCPPMSEGLEYKDGKVLVFFESACMKYLFGKVTGANYIFSYPLA